MAHAAMDLSENPRKRPQDADPEEGTSEWTLVASRKSKRGRPNGAQNLTEPPRVALNKFRVEENPKDAYFKIKHFKSRTPSLSFTAKPNMTGQWIITPHDHKTYEAVKNSTDFSVMELKREEKTKKAVLVGYPHHLPVLEICSHPQVLQAERMKNKEGVLTKTVLVTFVGKVPDKLELDVFGKFSIKPYYPEPLRCYNCQKFGHHKSACKAPEKCAVCSGRHATATCITKHKTGEDTHPRCPNCKQEHPAWSRRCPARLQRVQNALPKEKREHDVPTPTPRQPKKPVPAPRTKFYSKEELQRYRSVSQTRYTLPRNPKVPEPLPRTFTSETVVVKKMVKDYTRNILKSVGYETNNATLNALSTDLVHEILVKATRPPPLSSSTSSSSSSSSLPTHPPHPTPPSLPPPSIASTSSFPNLPSPLTALLPTPLRPHPSSSSSSSSSQAVASRDPRLQHHTSSC